MKAAKASQLVIFFVANVLSEARKRPRKLGNLRRNLNGPMTMTFDDPTHHQKLVDYCLSFQRGCGKPAADRYCEMKGYGEAIAYPKRRTYGEETLTLEQLSTCSPSHNTCDTFDHITCRVTEITFEDPREHGRALDGCLGYATESGVPAADAFCRDKGYGRSSEYSQIESTEEETMAIRDHSVCDPKWHACSTFTYVTCVASPGDATEETSGDGRGTE